MITIAAGDLEATIDPARGNNCRSLKLRGVEYIHTPADWHPPSLAGIPLLAPWANRLDAESYSANGRRYLLNSALGNLRFDTHHQPIHGLVLFTDHWRTIRQEADAVTSRLEFWRVPEWMAQFPFAHAIEITHRLRDGALEVETAIENVSNEPLPLCIGFHPFFRLEGSARDQWRVWIAAREQAVLSEKNIPTGARVAVEPAWEPLAGRVYDTVFTSLTGEEFAVEDGARRLTVKFGAKFTVAVVYAPESRDVVCFEPMTALTNAFNAENSQLTHVEPGETWRESFWIRPQ